MIILGRALAIVALASALAVAGPPATLMAGKPAQGAAVDPVFSQFKHARLACKFTEEKRTALLKKPITSSGTIVFDRDRGISRTTDGKKPQQVVLTRTLLRITKGTKVEEIPLDKTKDLKAFALIFPSLLRGDRAELEKSFELALRGNVGDWWALTLTPRQDALKKLIKTVTVTGNKGDLYSLSISEATGDSTETRITDIRKNGDVPDAEIATAFGAS